MKIHLTIDQISLEGIDLPRSQRPQLQAALEAEISRLFMLHGIPLGVQKGGHIPQLSIALIGKDNQSPQKIGQKAAQSIYTYFEPKNAISNEREKPNKP